MSAIFSVQNLQTFLRRKNLRPPSRGGPPGPERPPPPPPNLGRSPPERGPSPAGRDGRSATDTGAFVSSVITLLHKSVLSLRRCRSFHCGRRWRYLSRRGRLRAHLLFRVAQLLDLLQPLLLLVDAHG